MKQSELITQIKKDYEVNSGDSQGTFFIDLVDKKTNQEQNLIFDLESLDSYKREFTDRQGYVSEKKLLEFLESSGYLGSRLEAIKSANKQGIYL